MLKLYIFLDQLHTCLVWLKNALSSFLLIMDSVFQMDVPIIQYVPSSSG